MKLSYRGVTYEPKPLTLEVTEGEIGGMYRGQRKESSPTPVTSKTGSTNGVELLWCSLQTQLGSHFSRAENQLIKNSFKKFNGRQRI